MTQLFNKKMSVVLMLVLQCFLIHTGVVAQENAEFISFKPSDGGSFGVDTEGAGIDVFGNIYAVDYTPQGQTPNPDVFDTVAKIDPKTGATSLAFDLSKENAEKVNNILFDKDGNVYIGDKTKNVIFKLGNGTGKPEIICDFKKQLGSTGIEAPNDIVLTTKGKFFATGMNYNANTGMLLSCDRKGKVTKIYEGGRTNGIELDARQRFLYFTEGGANEESVQRIALKSGSKPEPVHKFSLDDLPATSDLDGMRFDVKGNLYVTMGGESKVAIINTENNNNVTFVKLNDLVAPRNLAIDSDTVYVIGKNGEKVTGMNTFPALAPGLRFSKLTDSRSRTSTNTETTTTSTPTSTLSDESQQTPYEED